MGTGRTLPSEVKTDIHNDKSILESLYMSGFTFTFHFHALEKEMATHSSVLAWRIPGTGEMVGCCLWGRTESDMTEAT